MKKVEKYDSFEETSKEVIEAMIEKLEEESPYETDPFCHYSGRLRLSFIKKAGNYRKRFVDGHTAIMEMLQEDRESLE